MDLSAFLAALDRQVDARGNVWALVQVLPAPLLSGMMSLQLFVPQFPRLWEDDDGAYAETWCDSARWCKQTRSWHIACAQETLCFGGVLM